MTYLIDRNGRVVHTWTSDYPPGASVYLLENGHLLRPARDPSLPMFRAGGQGGRIQEFSWDGELVWDFVIGGPNRMQHHDIEPLPGGNLLMRATFTIAPLSCMHGRHAMMGATLGIDLLSKSIIIGA